MRHAEHWDKPYRGVRLTIVNHSKDLEAYKRVKVESLRTGIWCGYAEWDSYSMPWIPLIKPVDAPSNQDWWDQFDWHGGITFYEEAVIGGHLRTKIGVDYAHAGDDAIADRLSPEYIFNDLKDVVDQVLKLRGDDATVQPKPTEVKEITFVQELEAIDKPSVVLHGIENVFK